MRLEMTSCSPSPALKISQREILVINAIDVVWASSFHVSLFSVVSGPILEPERLKLLKAASVERHLESSWQPQNGCHSD